MGRVRKGRDITGIVIVDKPTGSSSNHILQKVKHLFQAKKAGHTGSLDPLATGVLPICLGEATKVSSYLLDSDKRYLVTCRLGIVTDSGDSDGQVLSENPVPTYTHSELQSIIERYVGEQQQVPPMYSALKYQGQPLYKLARQGIEVERKARQITIYSIDLLECDVQSFTLDVRCSKGTYIRTLVEDISHELGCGGHVSMLRRTEAAGYELSQAVSLEKLQQIEEQDGLGALDSLLLPAHEALADWPAIKLDVDMTRRVLHGQTVQVAQAYQCANVRLFDENGHFLGLGEMAPEGVVAPKRLFVVAKLSGNPCFEKVK